MLLNNFMGAFLLYNFHASWLWWVGFIVIILFEVLYELELLERERQMKERLKDKIKKGQL
jgi:tellurite resistance protein TehA-like permease